MTLGGESNVIQRFAAAGAPRRRSPFPRTVWVVHFEGTCRLPNANGRIGEREKGASEKRRDDVHEEDLHDGHAWKDHSVADVRPVGGRELVRVGKDRRIATGARNDARHLVERHAEKEEAQDQDRQHERDQHNCTQAQHYQPGLGDGRGEFRSRGHPDLR